MADEELKLPAGAAMPPPYKCARYSSGDTCTKYYYDPQNGRWWIPGEDVPCDQCKWFMNVAETQELMSKGLLRDR